MQSLRQTMQAEAEKRKADAKAHEDRELETMRELRDAARDEAQQLRKELKDTRAEYEELLTQHRALQSQSDSSAAAAQGQLRVKEFETERLQAIRSEQQDALQELRAENEKLQKKCNYLESEYHRLEGSASRQAADLQSQLADAHSRLQQYEELEQDLDAEVESNGESMHLQYMPTSFQRRLKHSRQLAQKASQLVRAFSLLLGQVEVCLDHLNVSTMKSHKENVFRCRKKNWHRNGPVDRVQSRKRSVLKQKRLV